MPSNTYALDATWRPILKDLGVSAANVLRRAGLPEHLLAQPGVRLNSADFYRFWDGIDRELNDPLFPLRLCQAIRSESFSAPLFAALCSPNFLVAVQRIARYKALVAPMRLDLQQVGSTVTLSLVWPDSTVQPPQSLVLTELLFFVALARIGSRERICPLRVVTDLPPKEQDAYAEFFGVGVERGEGHHLTFRQADALRPFLTSNEGLWTAFEPELRTRLAELDDSVSLGERVRAILLEALPSGLIAADLIASKLALSKRTLQRQLEDAVHLTDRETDVLQRVAKGYTLAEIAQQFGLSRHTVGDHIKQIYKKLNVSSRAEAALEAARRGLVAP